MIEDHKGDSIPEEYRRLIAETLDLFVMSVGEEKPIEVIACLFTLIESAALSISANIGQDRTVYMLARMLQRLAEGSDKANIMVMKDPDAPL